MHQEAAMLAATAALQPILCKDLANIVLAFLVLETEAWDPWSGWQEVREFDSAGFYGHVPMCPTELPLF